MIPVTDADRDYRATFPIDLPLYLALNAPEGDLGAIYAHVQRITGETRPCENADLWNAETRTNVHGERYHRGRKATFEVCQGVPRPIGWDEVREDEVYECETYGWEVEPPTYCDDGSLYGDRPGKITWYRLD